MEDIGVKIARIQGKVEQLVAQNRTLGKENKQLMAAIEKLVHEKTERDKKIASLEAKIKVLELSRGLTDTTGSTKVARHAIKKILREIDSCIALINR